MPPRQRLPGVVLDSHVAEALVERVDRDSEAVSAPSTATHEGFEPVASIVEDEPVAHRAKPGRDVAGLTHSLLCGRDVPAPPVEISQRRSISAGPAGALGIHRGGRGCALSLLSVIDARRVVALPVQVSPVADDGTLHGEVKAPVVHVVGQEQWVHTRLRATPPERTRSRFIDTAGAGAHPGDRHGQLRCRVGRSVTWAPTPLRAARPTPGV